MALSADDTKRGCLLLHGYGGKPDEMAGLAAALADAGIVARIACLPGHGEDEADFGAYRFSDWLGYAEQELTALMRECGSVSVVGLSLGGTLALNLAARFPVSSVTAIAAPLYLLRIFPWPAAHMRFYAATLLFQLRRLFLAPERPAAKNGKGHAAAPQGYRGKLHLRQLLSFREGCDATRALLPRITAPLLAVHDARDCVVYCGNSWETVRTVSSARTALVMTRIQDESSRRHVLTLHEETRELVTRRVVALCQDKGLD